MEDRSDKIVLREYENEDEKQISHLFFNNFPDTLKPVDICQTWFWQFRNDFSKPSGVSVADLDDEEIFYLLTRGIPRITAERLMIEGFFDPIMQRIPFEGVRKRFQQAIKDKLKVKYS